MKVPTTITPPIPVVVRNEETRYMVQLMAKTKPIHTVYVRKRARNEHMHVGDRVATICYQFVAEGVLYGATWFRKEEEKEHWDKKKCRRLAMHRLQHAPIYLSLPLNEPWKERYPDEYQTFLDTFLAHRGLPAGTEGGEKAWNATLRHGFAQAAIRKAMHTEGCWQRNNATWGGGHRVGEGNGDDVVCSG